MKRKTVALFDPYLDTIGGGERHILSIMEVLEKERNFHPFVFWNENLKQEIENRLGLHFDNLTFVPNLFHSGSMKEKLSELRKYDIFLYVTDGSYFFASAKQNYVFCMVPDRKLYNLSLINRLKTFNYTFISNSRFTQERLADWGVQSTVLYPYISEDFLKRPQSLKAKDKTILSVGRFFAHLHSKRQDIAIKAFRELKKQPGFQDYRLILAGTVLKSDTSYVDELRQLIGNDRDIELLTNIGYDELRHLYDSASIYWHFAGYEIDERKNPERVEHLGITPLEAMASGCLTFCYAAGGPKEVIQDCVTGYLFSSIPELLAKSSQVLLHPDTTATIVTKAQQYVRKEFSYEAFKKNVLSVFDPSTA